MNGERADGETQVSAAERWGPTEFIPGDHVGLVGQLTVALIEGGHASTRDRLWGLVGTDAPIDDLLDELSATGLKSLPSFAVAQMDGDDLRLVARGATRLTVTFNDGSQQEVDPSDVRTWREDVVTDVARLSLSLHLEGDQRPPDLGDRFFVLAGSVPAVSLERRFDGPDALARAAVSSWEPPPAPTAQSDRRSSSASETPSPIDQAAPPIELADAEPAPTRVEPASDEADPSVVAEDLAVDEAEVSIEDSNQTISSADFADSEPVVASSTAPRAGMVAEAATGSDATAVDDSEAGDDNSNYDFIYGHTVARSVEGAAVRAADEMSDGSGLISSVPGEKAAVESGLAGDHDGMTISRADLAAMTSSPPAAGLASAGQDQVLAVLCGSGHPNPPHGATCRVCGVALGTSAPVSVPRPPLGVLVFSNGERVVADRTVLIGRNPRVSGTLTGELPRIVKLESAGQGLSRTHAEVRIEGWQMLLEDLQSTNGTEVTLPGQPSRRLHAGDPVALVPGATVDFGEELQCRVEVVS